MMNYKQIAIKPNSIGSYTKTVALFSVNSSLGYVALSPILYENMTYADSISNYLKILGIGLGLSALSDLTRQKLLNGWRSSINPVETLTYLHANLYMNVSVPLVFTLISTIQSLTSKGLSWCGADLQTIFSPQLRSIGDSFKAISTELFDKSPHFEFTGTYNDILNLASVALLTLGSSTLIIKILAANDHVTPGIIKNEKSLSSTFNFYSKLLSSLAHLSMTKAEKSLLLMACAYWYSFNVLTPSIAPLEWTNTLLLIPGYIWGVILSAFVFNKKD